MIQAVMLVILGFLLASLFAMLLAPSIWSRAARLTRRRIEADLPMTLNEIEAAQDRVRGTYAVRIRRLESALARAKEKAALQLVDNSRLHMQLASLKETIQRLELQLDERRNAATVFEQTIKKRFPELEGQVAELRQELAVRSLELQDLLNKLKRKDESLELAHRRAAAFEEEVGRLREMMEKRGADKTGRLLRRPSQWTLDDYRSEYDRLHLELSKLRQHVAQLQDRETHQVTLVKTELQKLSELILAASEQSQGAPARVVALPDAPSRAVPPRPSQAIPSRPLPWPPERSTTMPKTPAQEPGAKSPPSSQPFEPVSVPVSAAATPVKPSTPATAGVQATAQRKPSLVESIAGASVKPDAPAVADPKPDAADGSPKPSVEVAVYGAAAVARADVAAESASSAPETASAQQASPSPSETNATAQSPSGAGHQGGALSNGVDPHMPAAAASDEPASPAVTALPALRLPDDTASPTPPAQDGEKPARSDPPAKPFADARDLRALSELLTMNAGPKTEPGSKPASRSNPDEVAREARQGTVIDASAEATILEPVDPNGMGDKTAKRSLLDRLRNVPERAEMDK